MQKNKEKIIGLDLGSKSLGIAISDDLLMFAHPFTTIYFDQDNFNECLEKFKLAFDSSYKIVLGYPLNMDGTKSSTTLKIEKFQKMLIQNNYQVIFQDERKTSKISKSIMQEMKINKNKQKQLIDQISAMYILQNYLDSKI